ncbi:MAG: CDP-alcohol phosphatidyltransferase family protein [Spirochaetales bacterium]|nr:CDP-alcohol phosphatidyltransferase family protein [Spirochaetales bacterium]
MLAFFLMQGLLFGIILCIAEIPLSIPFLYYPVSFLYHIAFIFALIGMKRYFVLENTGEVLSRINLANRITLLRISAIPSIFFLFFAINLILIRWILLIYISFIFLTDFIDGILARTLKQITKIGRYIDSSGDYLILFFTSILYIYYSLIPTWLFLLILARIFTIAVTVVIMSFIKNEVVYTISFLGKASVFSLMLLFSLKLLPLFGVNNSIFTLILSICEYIIGGILIVSLGEKVILVVKAFLIKKKNCERNGNRE